MRKRSRALAARTHPAALLLLAACGGAGPYCFARTYQPLPDEAPFAERTVRASFEDVRRDPARFQGKLVAWFGVVTGIGELPKGRVRLVLSQRLHQRRHLCKTERERSCRVTVSERSLGDFAVDLSLPAAQRQGPDRVWFGSLLKVYGSPTGSYDAEGHPMLDVAYYRHWPRGAFVTTAARAFMRR